MSTQLLTKKTEQRDRHEQRITPNGTLFEFLSRPMRPRFTLFAARYSMEPRFPLHCHDDVELVHILERSVEAFQASDDASQWTTVDAGRTVTILGNTKYALRNTPVLPATMVVVTTSKLYECFREVTNQSGGIWGVRENEAQRQESVCIQCVNRKQLTFAKAEKDIAKVLKAPNGAPCRFRICGAV